VLDHPPLPVPPPKSIIPSSILDIDHSLFNIGYSITPPHLRPQPQKTARSHRRFGKGMEPVGIIALRDDRATPVHPTARKPPQPKDNQSKTRIFSLEKRMNAHGRHGFPRKIGVSSHHPSSPIGNPSNPFMFCVFRGPSLHHYTTPSLHHSITPSLHHSTTPPLHRSIAPSLHRSITPSLHRSIRGREVTERGG
jgi:hypothetical protein